LDERQRRGWEEGDNDDDDDGWIDKRMDDNDGLRWFPV